MVRVMQPSKVVIVTNGRYAGRKAVILKCIENDAERKFAHALIAGIDRAPLKVTQRMTKEKVARRTTVRPFLKVINYNHLLPTRYKYEDAQLKALLKGKSIGDPAIRKTLRKGVKKLFETKYKAGENRWFFEKLRF